MDFLWDKITEWLREMLIGGIVSNLSGMFDATNQKVAEISGQVGLSPQAWNGSIFSMIQNLSETVIVPIAGAILAFVMTLELIQLIMGEIDLNTYKAEKAACDELLLKTKNAYAAVLAQAKQKQDEQARQDSRKEASKALFDADTLTTELAELLIDRVLVYPDKRIEIAYKIRDIFD